MKNIPQIQICWVIITNEWTIFDDAFEWWTFRNFYYANDFHAFLGTVSWSTNTYYLMTNEVLERQISQLEA